MELRNEKDENLKKKKTSLHLRSISQWEIQVSLHLTIISSVRRRCWFIAVNPNLSLVLSKRAHGHNPLCGHAWAIFDCHILCFALNLPLQQWRGQQASPGQPDVIGWQREGKRWQSGGLWRRRWWPVQWGRLFYRPVHGEKGQRWDGGQRELRGHFARHLLSGVAL